MENLLLRSPLLLQLFPACLTWMVCDRRGKMPFNWLVLPGFVQDNTQHPCVSSHLAFFSKRFVRVQVVPLYSSTDTAIASKNSNSISLKRSDFHMVSNLSIAAHAFTMPTLISFSVDEILLPRFIKWYKLHITIPDTNTHIWKLKSLTCKGVVSCYVRKSLKKILVLKFGIWMGHLEIHCWIHLSWGRWTITCWKQIRLLFKNCHKTEINYSLDCMKIIWLVNFSLSLASQKDCLRIGRRTHFPNVS